MPELRDAVQYPPHNRRNKRMEDEEQILCYLRDDIYLDADIRLVLLPASSLGQFEDSDRGRRFCTAR